MSKYWGNNLSEKRLEEIKSLGLVKRIAELEAKVEALTPKPETKTAKVYFHKEQDGNIYASVFDKAASSDSELFAIKEVTVTKGEGL